MLRVVLFLNIMIRVYNAPFLMCSVEKTNATILINIDSYDWLC